jgi:hypothetical protein
MLSSYMAAFCQPAYGSGAAVGVFSVTPRAEKGPGNRPKSPGEPGGLGGIMTGVSIRGLILLAIFGIAGCGATPESLGITGPGKGVNVPGVRDDNPIVGPGISEPDNSYGPGDGTGLGGRYFNYN